jgi:hypothetical protein
VLSCTTMRSAVILSFGLLAAGILMLLVAETTGLAVPVAHTALVLALGGALTLAVAFLIAIWPGSEARLRECQH